MKSLEKFLRGTFSTEGLRPRITCKDGFTISVQASEYHYCTPRRNLKDGGYYEVELGYPSEADSLIAPYAERAEEGLTNTVYPYVPVDLVEELLNKHGGIV